MKEKRIPLLLGGFWEVLRFLFLFFLLITLGGSSPGAGRQNGLWLLLFGSGQLVLAAGFLFLYLDRPKYAVLTGFLILAKILSLFSALLLILLTPVGETLALLPSPSFAGPLLSLLALWAVVLLDLILLGVLLSGRSGTPETPPPPDNRPDFTETSLDPEAAPRSADSPPPGRQPRP